MNIVFNKVPGEIYDVFSTLWFINNFEYAKEENKKIGVEVTDKKTEEIISSIINNKKIDMQKLAQYFDRDICIPDLLGKESMWEKEGLEDYINFLNNIDSKILEEGIIKYLSNGDLDDKEVKDIVSSKDSILNYIKGLDIKSSIKWEIFSMINYKQSYMKELIEFVNDCSPIYKTIQKERMKNIKKFNTYLEQNIEESGLDFIKSIIRDVVNLDDFDNIYITSVYFDNLIINIKDKENSCYIFIGINFENSTNKFLGTNKLENNLNIFKNLSDKTRFEIIKLLLKRGYYGLEIAQELNITTATVSYHMNYLLVTGVVQGEKKDHKVYYSLNKNTLRNTIQFLIKELDL